MAEVSPDAMDDYSRMLVNSQGFSVPGKEDIGVPTHFAYATTEEKAYEKIINMGAAEYQNDLLIIKRVPQNSKPGTSGMKSRKESVR